MPEYDNTNRGAAFPNRKKNSGKHPDMTGSLNVDGTDYWVSVWDSTSKQGMPYLSIQVRRKDEVAAAVQAPQRVEVEKDLDDDIPF